MLTINDNEVHAVGTDLDVMADLTRAMAAVCMAVSKTKGNESGAIGGVIYSTVSMASDILEEKGYEVPMEEICESLLKRKAHVDGRPVFEFAEDKSGPTGSGNSHGDQ